MPPAPESIVPGGARAATREGSGASGARTRDLVTASHALSQLSYSPGEVVVTSKGNTCSPPVTGGLRDAGQPGGMNSGTSSAASSAGDRDRDDNCDRGGDGDRPLRVCSDLAERESTPSCASAR